MKTNNAVVIIVENEFVGTIPFSELFNEINKEIIERNAREYLESVA